jgi:hypothetical protein
MRTKRQNLVVVAEKLARKPFHDRLMGLPSNINPLTDHFPEGPRTEFRGKWCAAFVYHCCIQAGFEIPYRYPAKAIGSFAGVKSWLQWGKLQENRFYFSAQNSKKQPAPGDIVIYDHVFDPGPHDHIGIVLAVSDETIRVAEGNVHGISVVLERTLNHHIRGYIRIPNKYRQK